jgi:hypothetical protein
MCLLCRTFGRVRVLLSYYGQHVKEFEQRIAPMLKKGAKYEVKLEGKRLVLPPPRSPPFCLALQ